MHTRRCTSSPRSILLSLVAESLTLASLFGVHSHFDVLLHHRRRRHIALVCACACVRFLRWMVVDLKQFSVGQGPLASALWIVSQIPGRVETQDVTDFLVRQGFWPSYKSVGCYVQPLR